MIKRLKKVFSLFLAFLIAVSGLFVFDFSQFQAEAASRTYPKQYANEWYYPEGATFVRYIGVLYSGNADDSKNEFRNNGYTLLDYDLNAGAGGDWVYFGYKTTTNVAEAMRGVGFCYQSRDGSNTVNVNGTNVTYYSVHNDHGNTGGLCESDPTSTREQVTILYMPWQPMITMQAHRFGACMLITTNQIRITM